MRHRLLLSSVAAVLSLVVGAEHASADAVPPAPDSCPPGRVGVTSHRGPECVLEAPDDCAPGYRGRIRGKCVLAACRDDSSCEDDERCMQVDTCQEYRELHWNGWGWSAQRPVPAGNLFAEPPAPPPPGPPKKAWVQLKICGQDGACAAPAECRPAALCYPKDAIGKTKAKVTEPGSGGAPTDGDPPDVDPPPKAKPTSTPKQDVVVDPSGYTPGSTSPGEGDPPSADGGGCRKGCTTASPDASDTLLGAGLWLAAVVLLRRRLKGRRNDASR